MTEAEWLACGHVAPMVAFVRSQIGPRSRVPTVWPSHAVRRSFRLFACACCRQEWDALADNPLLNCRQYPTKNVRWRYLKRFPYRVVYEVDEANQAVTVAAVLHAARHDRHWKKRV